MNRRAFVLAALVSPLLGVSPAPCPYSRTEVAFFRAATPWIVARRYDNRDTMRAAERTGRKWAASSYATRCKNEVWSIARSVGIDDMEGLWNVVGQMTVPEARAFLASLPA